MIEFNGVLNINGIEKKIIIFMQLDFDKPYITDGVLNEEKILVKVKANKMIIDGTIYIYQVIKQNDEILIAGKEEQDMFHMLIPCIFRPNFFVLTDKKK